mmetsp:Transcript_11034/g.16568  ORF Transcript_11034/g.16568 Transcript_11034/m.16568 type:complete len:217 (+) Transcript_11034:171-821(+)
MYSSIYVSTETQFLSKSRVVLIFIHPHLERGWFRAQVQNFRNAVSFPYCIRLAAKTKYRSQINDAITGAIYLHLFVNMLNLNNPICVVGESIIFVIDATFKENLPHHLSDFTDCYKISRKANFMTSIFLIKIKDTRDCSSQILHAHTCQQTFFLFRSKMHGRIINIICHNSRLCDKVDKILRIHWQNNKGYRNAFRFGVCCNASFGVNNHFLWMFL